MSVWVLKLPAELAREDVLAARSTLPLPYRSVPELSGITNEQEMRQLLATVKPDSPPETTVRQAEIYWRNLSGLAVDDLLVVPYVDRRAAGLAQVVRAYRYEQHGSEDCHLVEVHWLETNVPRYKFHATNRFIDRAVDLQPMLEAEDRKYVYRLLKHSYNRFAKWQWLAGLLIIVQMIMMLVGMMRT